MYLNGEIGGCGFRRLCIDVSNDTAINTHAQMQTVNASQQQLLLKHDGSVILSLFFFFYFVFSAQALI